MTCSIPDDIEQQLAARAAKRQTTTDAIVVEALTWYLQRSLDVGVSGVSGAEALGVFRQLQQAAGMTPRSAEGRKAAIVQARR